MTANKTVGSPWIDPDDAPVLTDAGARDVEVFRGDTFIQRGRGRPKTGRAKELVSLRLDPDILTQLRLAGPGWQAQVNGLLRQALGLNGAASSAGDPSDTTGWTNLVTGAAVITVEVPEPHAARVTDILERHNPIDIDERATGYGLGQATAAAPVMPATQTAATGGTVQLAEESLAVGKRLVNSGGARIRRYVVETPVQQDVTLRSEKVELKRRPVTDGRPVTDSFSEKTAEMLATGEEAVVGKTARVVEEVGLRKGATERTETVRGTVRKEEVAVEQMPDPTAPPTPVPPYPVPDDDLLPPPPVEEPPSDVPAEPDPMRM